MAHKKYYWLKLHDDFFDSKRIKKLRKMAGGDTYTIIYLKLQLLALKNDGVLHFDGLETDFASEIALDINEEPEIVKVTVAFLMSCGLAETSDNVSFFFPYTISNTGKESSSAERVRKHRERLRLEEPKDIETQKALQCNTEALHSCYNVTAEKEIEKDIDKDNPPIIPPKGKRSDEYDSLFDRLWKSYPRKVAKENAREAFAKLKPNDDLLNAMLSAIEKQKKSEQWAKDNGQFIPYPATWLNQHRWEDEMKTNYSICTFDPNDAVDSILRRTYGDVYGGK